MPLNLVPRSEQTHLESSVFRYVQETLGLKDRGIVSGGVALKPSALDMQHLVCEPTDPVLEVEQVIHLERWYAAGVRPLSLSL